MRKQLRTTSLCHRIIALGQAYVRIIESTDVLLERKVVWMEQGWWN